MFFTLPCRKTIFHLKHMICIQTRYFKKRKKIGGQIMIDLILNIIRILIIVLIIYAVIKGLKNLLKIGIIIFVISILIGLLGF